MQGEELGAGGIARIADGGDDGGVGAGEVSIDEF